MADASGSHPFLIIEAKLSGIAFFGSSVSMEHRSAGFIVLFGSNHTPVLTDEAV